MTGDKANNKAAAASTSKAAGEKWEKQKPAIRATQLAFDLSAQIQKAIKKQAIDSDLTPSDMIRHILGLTVKSKKTRQRLSFYLNDEELAALAKRYNIAEDDKLTIKQKVAQELIDYATESGVEQ